MNIMKGDMNIMKGDMNMKKVILAVVATVAAFAASMAATEKPAVEPRWSGAQVAEWTMDYASALKAAKAGGNWSIMYYTGSWWCPWCQAFETKVLESDAWQAYAAGRGFYEIELDYPARNGTGRFCWLWDEDYLAKNGLNATKATAALKDFYAQQDKYALPDARKQVCTNGTAKVTYKRINYPSILVLRPDGSVAGRFVPGVLDGYEFDGDTPNPEKTWSVEEALDAVTNAIELVIANANTHVTTSVAEDCAGMGTVTILDKTVYTGASVPVKAAAAKGFYFAGWYENGEPADTVGDYRTASNNYVTKGGEAALEARFVEAKDDFIFFDVAADISFFDVGEEIEPVQIAIESETVPAVKVTGLPSGLKFDAKTMVISGKPTKEGFYYVTIYAKNASGYEYTQTAECIVGEPEEPESPFDVYVDFDGLSALAVGVAVGDKEDLESAVCIGEYDGMMKEGITKVAGLPAGLELVVVEDKESKVKTYFVVGTPTKPGAYSVTVTCTYLDEKGKAVSGAARATLIVDTLPSVFLSAESAQLSDGSVSGGGVYAWGATAKLSAKPTKNNVFVGWFGDSSCETPIQDESFDFRNPTLPVVIDDMLPAVDWYACFTYMTNDTEVAVVGYDFSDGDVVEFDSDGMDEPFVLSYEVDSLSLPTVKVTGLPAGFEYSTTAPGQVFTISYDPSRAKKVPVPGVYTVKITATNVSKKSAVLDFTIKVANIRSEMIPVEDVLPDDDGFIPGVSIDPIDFSDIAESGTLDVTGLPKGLTFNKKADAKKGVEANTVTGAPTTPGSYTVTFTLKTADKATYTATSTFVVAPFPELTVEVDEEAAEAGCKVTGAGGYMAGSKATLKATAAKGWVFAGWEGYDGSLMQLLNPTLQIVTGDEDAAYKANFLRVCDDWLWIYDYDSGVEGDDWSTLKLDLNSEIGENAEAILDLVDSGSLPTVSVSGLPSGLKFDAKTLLLSGKPTKPGVYYANVSAKNVGGYTHSIVIRIMVRNADGSDVEEPAEENTAGIDLTALDDMLTTGELVEDLAIEIPGHSEDGSDATAVSVSGLPKGLTATFDRDEQIVMVAGIPTAAGRATVKFAVTYASKKKASAVHSVIVRNGGSAYLFVESSDRSMGEVTGEGVYAAGATVKLTAKAGKNNVFAGWTYLPYFDDELGEEVVTPIEIDGYDFRAPSVSFAMTTDLADETVVGCFVPTASDASVSFEADETVWTIDPDESSALVFSVLSASLPTVKATGLPKGVTLAKDGTSLVYSKADKSKLAPGKYTVELTAQNVSKAKASMAVQVVISVAASDFFQGYGLNQSDEGYSAMVGVLASSLEDLSDVYAALADDGLDVTFKNLPAGIKATSGVVDEERYYSVDGVPTKPGTYVVTVTAKGKIDNVTVSETAQFFLTVEPLPDALVGTFNGSVYTDDSFDFESETPRTVSVGSLTVTVSGTGAVTAKIVRPTGAFSFAATGWDEIDEGGATVLMCDTKSGRMLNVAVEFAEGLAGFPMSAYFDEGGGKAFLGRAQRNAFAAGDAEALAVAAALKGTYCFDARGSEETYSGEVFSYAYNPKTPVKKAALSMTVDAKGGAKFAGKYGTKSVSGSTVLAFGTDALGATTVTAELVWKNDAESVGIATVVFVYDDEVGAWSLVEPDGVGATVEVYDSDCASCED